VSFRYDYSAATRWVFEDGSGAVTIEPVGRVAFARFDMHPSRFAGVVWRDAPFDEVADESAPAAAPTLWHAAAEHLCAVRRPGTTPHITVALGDFGGARVLAYPYEWCLDGKPLSSPHVPGPDGANLLDERPALQPRSLPYPIAMEPGVHLLEGKLRRFAANGAVGSLTFSITIEVARDSVLSLDLSCSALDSEQLQIVRTSSWSIGG